MGSRGSIVSDSARFAERQAPERSPVMYQSWRELLFLHWAVDPALIASSLPHGLSVDTYAGKAYLGVVPFQMSGIRPRYLSAVPGISSFPELNLRTYVVDAKGRPGVWFYSLDTPKRLPNWIARTFFHLNYRLARMTVSSTSQGIDYRAALKGAEGFGPEQRYLWEREGAPFEAELGSFEFFLVERYRLFAYDARRKRLRTGQVAHVPYPLQGATLHSHSLALFNNNDFPEPNGAPVSILASSGVDVRIYPMVDV